MTSRRSFIHRILAGISFLCFGENRKAVTEEPIGVEDMSLPNGGKFELSKASRTFIDWNSEGPHPEDSEILHKMAVTSKTHPDLISGGAYEENGFRGKTMQIVFNQRPE